MDCSTKDKLQAEREFEVRDIFADMKGVDILAVECELMLLDTTPEKVVAFSTANMSVYTDMFAVDWELMLLNSPQESGCPVHC